MKRVELVNAKLDIEKLSSTWGSHHYKVYLVSGQWPDAEDLLTICDNLTFGTDIKRHFGGVVEKFGNEARVEVYFD